VANLVERERDKMKKIITIAIFFLIALLALSYFKDAIVKGMVENGVEFVTGLQLKMKGLNVGLTRNIIDIEGLKIFNPTDFVEKVMVDMPEVYINYDPVSIMRGDPHLKKLRIYLNELMVVKNAEGKLNLHALKVVKASKRDDTQQEKTAPARHLRIDDLRLRIGKAVYKDYSKGSPPFVREFYLNLDERYSDVRSLETLVSLIVVRTLRNTAIAGLANFDLGSLTSAISTTLLSAEGIAEKGVGITREALKKTTEETKGIVEELGSIFKSPPGSKKD